MICFSDGVKGFFTVTASYLQKTMSKDTQDNAMDLLGKKMEVLLKTGQLLIQSGADSNRIDRNMRRVAIFLGIGADDFHMHITFTTMMISISDGTNVVTKFKKCLRHSVNMTIVSEVSNLSWNALEKGYSMADYEQALEKISAGKHHYPRALVIFAVGIACACFGKLFGCDLIAMLITAVASSTAMFVRQELHKRHINNYMNVAVCSFIAVFISASATYLNISETPFHPIFASVLFMIPGVPLINSLDDMIDGFTIVGWTRAVVAFLIIASIAAGMVFALKVLNIQNYGATLLPHNHLAIIALSGAAAATGFAILFNVPVRTLFLCALGGAIAVSTRNVLLYQMGFSLPLSSFCGALMVGIFCIYWVHAMGIPGHVISIPPVIPMIPGVLLYKAIIGILTLGTNATSEQVPLLMNTYESGIKAIMTLFGLSLGVAIPNILDRFFSAKLKQRRMARAIKKRENA